MESNRRISEIVSLLCDRKTGLEDFNRYVNDLNRVLPALVELEEINPKLALQREELSRLEKKKIDLDREYKAGKESCDSLKIKIPALQVEMAGLKAEKSELEKVLASQTKDLEKLTEKDLEELKAQINHLKGRIKFIHSSQDKKDYFYQIIESLEQEIMSD